MNGVPLAVVARLLGHSNLSMTMRYAHFGDRDIEAAAERVGQAVAAMMAGQGTGNARAPADGHPPPAVTSGSHR